MKKVLAIILLSVTPIILNAQKVKLQNLKKYDQKRLHFGFSVGVSTADFTIRNSDNFFNTSEINEIYSIEAVQNPGFQLGPISNLRLGKYFDLRLLVYLTFAQRNLQYQIIKDTVDNQPVYARHDMKLSSTFLEFPLQIKYKAMRINNFRPYIIAGINPKIDFSSRKKIPENEMPKIKLKQKNLYGEVGLGIDFYTTYFKFSPQIKFSFGLRNMLETDGTQYSSSINYLKSNMIMISFHFE